MEPSNIIVADMKQKNKCYTKTVYQYNYGMVLQIINYDLPETYEVHFSNTKTGVAKSQLGSVAGVRIPGEYFIPGQYIYAWIFTHPTEGSGVTVAEITIPISDRAKYTDEI